MFPLIKNFTANTFTKAFLINALCSALIASASIRMKSYLDNLKNRKKNSWSFTEFQKMIIVFFTAFIVSIITYYILYLLIGFGGGMMV